MKMPPWAALALLAAAVSHAREGPAAPAEPIIDMHLHTRPWTVTETAGQREDYTRSWTSIEEELDQNHIVLALVSGSQEIAAHWQRLSPSRIVAGALFPCEGGLLPNSGGRKCFPDCRSIPDLAWLRTEIQAGRVGFLGEITSQYAAMAPTDPLLEPYFALAEELDVPVAIHMGPGPPGAIYPNGVDHGFGKRVMWGSDFPQFKQAIAALESVPCLSEEQKRDILYDNAVRFLRLSKDQGETPDH